MSQYGHIVTYGNWSHYCLTIVWHASYYNKKQLSQTSYTSYQIA